MLEVKNIKASFGETSILNGISFSCDRTAGIIGPNGSGKTTLFNVISGFTPATAGSVLINGIDVSRQSPDARARSGLSRIFQNFGVFKNLSVIDNVMLALSAKDSLLINFFPSPSRKKIYREKADHYLHQVGLIEKRLDMASNLSGGQLRLLEIARAMAMDSAVYLLDEPTAGVSPKLKGQVASAIRLLIDAKKTVLIIEHDMAFIRSFVDRIIVLNQGVIVADGTPQTVVDDPIVREIYFGG